VLTTSLLCHCMLRPAEHATTSRPNALVYRSDSLAARAHHNRNARGTSLQAAACHETQHRDVFLGFVLTRLWSHLANSIVTFGSMSPPDLRHYCDAVIYMLFQAFVYTIQCVHICSGAGAGFLLAICHLQSNFSTNHTHATTTNSAVVESVLIQSKKKE
jgi:hypothetical protein